MVLCRNIWYRKEEKRLKGVPVVSFTFCGLRQIFHLSRKEIKEGLRGTEAVGGGVREQENENELLK